MKTSKKLLALLLALVMMLGLFAGCKKSSGGKTDTDADGEPKYGGHLNVRIAVDPRGLDPVKETGDWRYIYTSCVYENALTRDAEYNIAPAVCNFKISDDYLTLKLWVRDNAIFHNGDTVDIYDVEASLNRSMNLYSSWTKYVQPYVTSMTVDGDALTITFSEYREKIWYYLAGYQTWGAIMPKEICEKYADSNITGQVEDAIGTGPYRFVDCEVGSTVTIEKFNDYVPYGEGRTGLAGPKIGYLDSMTFIYNGSDDSAALAALAGNYDLVEVMPSEYLEMAEEAGLVLDSLDTNAGTAMLFNTMGTNICAKYPDLRKAIMAAIDYEEYLALVCDNSQVMGGCPVVGTKYYTDVFVNADYYGESKPELAASYLEAAREAGYNDEPVQLVLSNHRTDIPTLLGSYLDAAGIPYELRMMDASSTNEYYTDTSNNWDFYFTWPSYGTTPGALPAGYIKNYYENAAKDEILAKMESMIAGSDEYMALWNELAQIIVDDCSSVYMSMIYWFWYHPADFVVNDQGLNRYLYNSWWTDPENHTA